VLVAVSIALAVSILLRGPISQDEEYHCFADQRARLSIPNALDVLSNLPFLLVGAAGLATLRRASRSPTPPARWERAGFLILSIGVTATAFGSAYYHLGPCDRALVWDRLPMTLVFTSLVALVLGERIGPRVGRTALGPLVALGVGSVIVWAATIDGHRGDDLRLYVFVQSLAIVTIPVLVLVTPEPRSTRRPLVLAFLAYLLAKQFEGLDADIFRVTCGAISGHTMKHVASAVAAAFLVRWFSGRFSAPGLGAARSGP
jgi:hypothetical protein